MADKYAGFGGSYVVNKKTGARELMERTNEDPAPAPEEAAPVDTETSQSE